jgi:hypothetical protein
VQFERKLGSSNACDCIVFASPRQAFGLINVTAPAGLEADDVIATFSAIGLEQVQDMKVRHEGWADVVHRLCWVM